MLVDGDGRSSLLPKEEFGDCSLGECDLLLILDGISFPLEILRSLTLPMIFYVLTY